MIYEDLSKFQKKKFIEFIEASSEASLSEQTKFYKEKNLSR